MPSRRLTAIVTALLFLDPARGLAEYSIEQLLEIEELILGRDCGALRDYLRDNPAVMEGVDPLAAELRSFASDVDRGLISCVAAQGGDPSVQRFSETFAGTY